MEFSAERPSSRGLGAAQKAAYGKAKSIFLSLGWVVTRRRRRRTRFGKARTAQSGMRKLFAGKPQTIL